MNYLSVLLSFLFIINEAGSESQTKVYQTTKEVIETIEQLNQSKSRDKGCRYCLRFSGSENENESQQTQESEILQQCAVDLCGPANENSVYVLNNETFDKEDIDPEIVERFNEKIRPVIEEMAQAELNHNKGILKSLQDKLQNPESNIAPREWDEIAELLSMGIMDKTAFTEMLTGLIGDEAPYLVSFSEIERNGDASYRANKEAKMMSLSVTADLLKLSSPSVKRQRDLLRKRYREFLKDYEKNKEKFTEDDKQTITQLGKVLEDRYLDSLSFADSLDHLIKKSKDIVFCVEEDCKKWVLNELSSLHQNLKENTSSEGYRQRLNWWINHCQSVYNADIQSAEHVKQYKQKSSEYKDRFMNKVFANYSTVSRRSYTGYMNALHFDFPLPEQGVEQQLVDDIREEAIDTVSYSNNKIIDLMQDRERLADEYSVCPSPISTIGEGDFFDKMTNTIGVSHFSCRFHEHGKQTLAHELAHALSHWFGQNKPDLGKLNKPSKKSYAQYMKLRECANKRYKANNKSKPEIHVRFGHNNDQFRTEEDMADLIAYQVFQDDPTLVQCSLLVSSEDGSEYQFLRMLHPPLSKEGHEIADPHSTALLRTITEAIHKGKQLSPACRKIVSLYSDKINFDSCL